jgi:hypothetical protein
MSFVNNIQRNKMKSLEKKGWELLTINPANIIMERKAGEVVRWSEYLTIDQQGKVNKVD